MTFNVILEHRSGETKSGACASACAQPHLDRPPTLRTLVYQVKIIPGQAHVCAHACNGAVQ
eukprot:458835-Pelagomonas_calceolata.AAC.1